MHEKTRGGQGILQELRGGGCRSKGGQIEDGSRFATSRAQGTPRRSRISSVSPLEASVELQQLRLPYRIQGSEGAYENVRKRAVTRQVCPDRPPSRTRLRSVDIRQEFGTQGRIGVWGHDIRSGVVKVALRGLTDAKNSRTVLVLSSLHLQCRKHGHHVRGGSRYGYRGLRVGEASHVGPAAAARYSQDSTSDDEPLVRPNASEETLFRGDRTDIVKIRRWDPEVAWRHYWTVWRKILQSGTVRS